MKLPVRLILPSLLSIAAAGAAERTWIRSGTSSVWNNSANWGGSTLPVAGDDLLFSAAAAVIGGSSNNFTAGTAFGKVSVTAPNYVISGQTVNLSGGLDINYSSGLTRMSIPFTLTQNQTWRVGITAAQAPDLQLEGDLSLAGRTLTINNTGTFSIQADVTGTGLSTMVLTGDGLTTAVVNQAWTGNIVLQSGQLDWRRLQSSGLIRVAGGSIGGTGTAAALTVDTTGVVDPGLATTSIGHLSVNGNTVFSGSGVKFRPRIGGAGNFDTLTCRGAIILGGSFEPEFAAGLAPVAGTRFDILENQSGAPMTGAFSNAAEGATIRHENRLYRITYKGGNNDDGFSLVTLSGGVRRFNGGALINADLWSKDNNWEEDSAPSTGMNLVFGPFASAGGVDSAVNDYNDDTTFGMLRLEGTGYSLAGARVILTNGIEFTSPTSGNSDHTSALISLSRIRLAQDQPFLVHAGRTLTINSPLDLNGRLLTTDTRPGATLICNGAVSGAGGIFKTGQGTLLLDAANSFTGSMTVSEGTATVLHPGALGSSAVATVVAAGAELEVRVPATESAIAEPLLLSGTLTGDPVAPVKLSGAVTLGPEAALGIGGDIELSGPVDGAGGFNLSNVDLILSGTVANTYAAATKIGSSRLTLSKSTGVTAVPGVLEINDRGIVTVTGRENIADSTVVQINEGTLELRFQETVAGISALSGGQIATLGAGAQLILAGDAETSAVLDIRTPVRIAGASGVRERRFTVNGPSSRMLVNESVSGDAGLVLSKRGEGRIVFNGDNSVAAISADAGETFCFGNSPTTLLRINGGSAAASGALARIEFETGGGFFTPSRDAAVPHDAALVTSGRLTLRSTAVIEFDLNGTTRGGQFDAIDVTTVAPSLGNAVLSIVRGFSPPVGTAFRLIDNQTSSPVTGTFAALPEGSGITLPGGFLFAISYRGGDGNDVVLTRVTNLPVPPQLLTAAFSKGTGPGGQDQVGITGKADPSATATLEFSTDLSTWTVLQPVTANGAGQISITVNQAPGILRRWFRLRY